MEGLFNKKNYYDPANVAITGTFHFTGAGRPVILHALSSDKLHPSHHNPLEITSLAASAGITVDGMDTAPATNRRIEVVGIDGGINVKGRLINAYTRYDTTAKAKVIKIKLTTTNATWTQATQWRITLDIASGDDIIGDFTIHMPPFNIDQYNDLEVYVTKDGSTYALRGIQHFCTSVAGSVAATEPMLNNESAGSDVVIDVTSTTGFYVGNKCLVSDDNNNEFARIKSISLNSSITVNSISNNYTTAANAKLDIIDYTKTAIPRQIQRGMMSVYVLLPSINSGIIGQLPIPHSIDTSEDIGITLQYLPTTNNAGNATVRFRLQYLVKGIGVDIPDSYQYGTSLFSTLTPPATKVNALHILGSIPAAIHSGKHALSVKLVREGIDALDTYTGDIKVIAIIFSWRDKQLGYEA